MRLRSLNIGTIGKRRKLADMMGGRKVDILSLQETRWKGNKARSAGGGFSGSTMM